MVSVRNCLRTVFSFSTECYLCKTIHKLHSEKLAVDQLLMQGINLICSLVDQRNKHFTRLYERQFLLALSMRDFPPLIRPHRLRDNDTACSLMLLQAGDYSLDVERMQMSLQQPRVFHSQEDGNACASVRSLRWWLSE